MIDIHEDAYEILFKKNKIQELKLQAVKEWLVNNGWYNIKQLPDRMASEYKHSEYKNDYKPMLSFTELVYDLLKNVELNKPLHDEECQCKNCEYWHKSKELDKEEMIDL